MRVFAIFNLNLEDPCLPNPCQNGGTCQSLGTYGFACLCPTGCLDANCTNCKCRSIASKIGLFLHY